MVKIDYARDYYADLEASPTDSIDALKKQYRKLALKYHPDRNPDDIEEANIKFTVIQTAMEVLTNNEQRQKYDSHRQGRYGYPRASGVKGNPYADLSKNFPPPPRPPGFPPRPPMQKRQPTGSTADKYAEYASYTKDAPSASASRRAGKADATWKAWEGMRPQNKATGQSTASGASSRTASGSRPASAAKPPPVPPRAPPPQKQPEGAFGNSTRASRGYVPQSPSGDEPPVSNNNYFTTRIHSNVFPTTSAAARNRRRAPSGTGGPDAESGDSASADPRLSTPYQTQGGEKFDPYSSARNIGRSRSTRETNRQSHHDEQNASPTANRQRSASNPDDADFNPQGAQNVNGRPNNRGDADAAMNNGGDFSFAGDNKGKRTSDLYAQCFPSTQNRGHENPQGAQHSTSRAGDAEFYARKTLYLPPELQELLAKEYQKSLSKDTHTNQDQLNAFELSLQDTISRLSAKKYGPAIHQPGFKDGQVRYATDSQPATQENGTANSKVSNSNFNTQFSGDQPHRFSRNSTENINTRFVAEDEATNWQFNAGSPVGEKDRPTFPRSSSGSRMGRPPTTSSQTQQTQFPEPVNGGVSPKNASFNPEEWSEKIGPQIFEAPAVHRTSTSTSRSSRNTSRKPKPVRMTAGTAGLVDSDESSSGQEDPAKKSTPSVDAVGAEGAASPNAMDIDPPAVNTGANGVRNIPVTPSRPEWRAGNVGGIKVDSAPDIPPQPVFAPPAGGSEDSEEFRAKLSDLRNVEPLAGRASGLDSFSDLKSNLPFPSAASGQVPTRKPVPNKAHDLPLPMPPKPPHPPPALAVPGLKPSAIAWQKYADSFTVYVAEWHAYNAKYADHFKARMAEVKNKMLNPLWLQSKDGAGIQEYMLWVEQDREVRARWTEVSDEHEMNVRLFSAHREKMMK